MDNNRKYSNIGYPNYPMMNGGVFSASYANTPAYTDTPGNVTTSELISILPHILHNIFRNIMARMQHSSFKTFLYYLTRSI